MTEKRSFHRSSVLQHAIKQAKNPH